MGIPDNTLLDLIEKVRSWISWGSSDLISQSCEAKMANEACRMCSQCEIRISGASFDYNCQRCNRVFCDSCVQGHGSFVVADAERGRPARLDIQSCKFCADMDMRHKVGGKYSHKIHPSDSPRQSPEPPSPDCSGERFDAASLQAVSVQRSPGRSDEEDGEDSAKHFFSPYSLDISDVDSSSVSTRHEFYSFLSVGSSPSDSPSRIHITSNRGGQSVQPEEQGTPRSQNDGPFGQETMAILKSPDIGIEDSENTYDDVSVFRNQCEKLHKPLDFENNGHIWFPPPPEDEKDDAEDGFFSYNDDDDEMGESSAMFSSSDSLESMIPEKDKQNEYIRKPLRDVVQGHFRALISQLLQAESIAAEEWLDIITTLAWQAANFVKPDTSRGGSMDPGDYVKVKCIASGSPGESTFVKGVVCTKNIKHKRMSSQYKSPRLLLLGGALEYQRAHNQLASFDTLLQQEMDHLKMIVSRIEAHRTNVLLVEKTVSSRAQEYLLLKEISLVLNVKRPLLERIARCTGASITPSVDKIPTARLGQCELFRLEKVSEEHEVASQLNKKPSKTLMFFEGCPRRLGCTILLKGLCREDLKKVKHVIQYAVFAAYHLSLETSFLADEGAFLPKMTVTPSTAIPEHIMAGNAISVISNSVDPAAGEEIDDCSTCTEVPAGLNLDLSVHDLVVERPSSPPISIVGGVQNLSNSLGESAANVALDNLSPEVMPSDDRSHVREEFVAMNDQGESQLLEPSEPSNVDKYEEVEASSEYYSASDNRQCIVVSKSSRCVLNGNVCERSTLWRIKFYGINDKPLGRYLQEYLFDQACCCSSCKELVEAHVICYTHQQGNLTINVRRLPSVKLPGERDGKIWMWHRCLRCEHIDGVPPATRRVVMSDAAWGLSFGKFLELSFSNHATANRVASCGHSLQRDCLRFYGFGSTVAFFRYSPIDILSVHLPPSVLQFSGHSEQVWLRKEAEELWRKTEALYEEIVGALHRVEQKNTSFGYNLSDSTELSNYIMELKDLLVKERREYNDLLQPCEDSSLYLSSGVDVFELNRLRHALMIGLHVWDRRLYSLESLFGRSSSKKVTHDVVSNVEVKYLRNDSIPKESLDHVPADPVSVGTKVQETIRELPFEQKVEADRLLTDIGEGEDLLSSDAFPFLSEQIRMDMGNSTSLERAPSAASVLSEQIDSAWSGTLQKDHVLEKSQVDGPAPAFLRQINEFDNPQFRRLSSPVRVYSFDSALTFQERLKKGISASPLQLSAYGSFHGSGDYSNMVRDPISNVHRSYSQLLPFETQKLDLLLSAKPSLISSVSLIPEGARLLLPQGVRKDLVIAVYDNEPTSIISYALTSKEYEDWFTDKPNGSETHINHLNSINGDHSGTSNGSVWQSFRSLELDYIHYGSYGSEDASIGSSSLFTDSKSSPHLTIPFEDESLNSGKVKFSVTCYFAKQFDALRKKCCPSEVEFVRSLSRCKRWDAQGGKSNAYFAKTLDERFIIKQVSKTELESFEEFAPQYFKYLSHCLSSGTPTCLAKIVGIYQVTVKHLRGGKEAKMHVMVMENLFFKRNISRVYDLKGSERSRYNSDTTGANKTLLDMNLLETLRTHPIFLGSKAKRTLERAVWNDTNFLASIDVMDYSLLVGVDEERKELVLGIIDFMRQYTWDKHLETWVKASGILGGPKNASPTIISPLQYKRRFRKAMTSYFLTVPDNVGSS